MDSNPKATPTNATDSSMSSLTALFRQLEVDSTCTGDGPINRLPNEIMQLVMTKLGLDGEVNKLIRLRLVSTRWRAVVEDYCRLKKFLLVDFHTKRVLSENTLQSFEKTFFGFANSKNFTCLFLKTKIPSECSSSLLEIFSNVEQLSINCGYVYGYEPIPNSSLEVYINSLGSLKLLDLNGFNIAQLSPALSKLEHLSCNYNSAYDHNGDLLQAISHLEQTCVRVNFGERFSYDQVLQWHNINPFWLGNLTQLRMHIRCNTSAESVRVVHFLCEHAILLQHLDFNNLYGILKLTPTVLEDLGKLTHLTNLVLNLIKMCFPKLEKLALQHRLPSLTSVLTCKLCVSIYDHVTPDQSINGEKFARVLSVIFPNLVELDLTFRVVYPRIHVTRRGQLDLEMKHEIEQHLGRFSNLRKHKISVY